MIMMIQGNMFDPEKVEIQQEVKAVEISLKTGFYKSKNSEEYLYCEEIDIERMTLVGFIIRPGQDVPIDWLNLSDFSCMWNPEFFDLINDPVKEKELTEIVEKFGGFF